MENMKRILWLLALLSLALLAGCGSPDSDSRGTGEMDGFGTVTRNGQNTLVCVCHDRKAIHFYRNDEAQTLFDTAGIPPEIYDEDWILSRFSFYDSDGDGNSDLQVRLSHSDMSESDICWTWVEGEGYVYQWAESRLYNSIVVRYPDDGDSEGAPGMYRYVGVWLSDGDSPYDDAYIEFDWYGNWTVYSAGELVDEGCLHYEPEGDSYYADSFMDSAIDGGRVEVEDNRLSIPNLGSFTHLVPENDSGDVDPDGEPDLHQRDVAQFEGTWYRDNDLSAQTYIVFDDDGNWSLYQRAPGDAEGTEMDRGIISRSDVEVSTYYADSIRNDDVSYRVVDVAEDAFVWDDAYTYYRME